MSSQTELMLLLSDKNISAVLSNIGRSTPAWDPVVPRDIQSQRILDRSQKLKYCSFLWGQDIILMLCLFESLASWLMTVLQKGITATHLMSSSSISRCFSPALCLIAPFLSWDRDAFLINTFHRKANSPSTWQLSAIIRALFTKVAKTDLFWAGWWWLGLFKYRFVCNYIQFIFVFCCVWQFFSMSIFG